MPDWLSGDYSFGYVAQVQGSLAPDPGQGARATLHADLPRATISFSMDGDHSDVCEPLRFRYGVDPDEGRSLSAFNNGFNSTLPENYSLDVACPKGQRRGHATIEVIDKSLIAL